MRTTTALIILLLCGVAFAGADDVQELNDGPNPVELHVCNWMPSSIINGYGICLETDPLPPDITVWSTSRNPCEDYNDCMEACGDVERDNGWRWFMLRARVSGGACYCDLSSKTGRSHTVRVTCREVVIPKGD